MRHAIIRALKTDLVKVSSLIAGTNVLKVIAAIISNKVAAAYLGPAGIALLGQFYNFGAIAVAFASLGVGVGVTKYTAEYRDDKEKRALLLSTAASLGLLATGITTLVIFCGRFHFADIIFQSGSFAPLISLLAASLVFLTGNSFLLSLLAGHKEFNIMARLNIASALLGLAITVILTVRFLLWGALSGMVISQTMIFFVTLYGIMRTDWWSWRDCRRKFDAAIARNLLKYSCMVFTNVIAVGYIQLLIRGYIIQTVSLTDAGYWQGIMRFSESYVMFGLGTLAIYYLPRMSEIQTTRELRREVLKVFLFAMPVTIVSSVALYAARELIITWLFTESFNPMRELFLFQFLGNIFRIAGWLLAYILLARAKTLLYIVSELSRGVFFYFSTVFLVRTHGVIGATYSYAITYVCYVMAMAVLCALVFRDRHTVSLQTVPGYSPGDLL